MSKDDKEVQRLAELFRNVKAQTAAEKSDRVLIDVDMDGVGDGVESHMYFRHNAIQCFIKSKRVCDYIAVLQKQLQLSCNEKGYGVHVLGTNALCKILSSKIGRKGMLVVGSGPSVHTELVWIHVVWYAEIANHILAAVYTPWNSSVHKRGKNWVVYNCNGELFGHCSSLHVDVNSVLRAMKATLRLIAKQFEVFLNT